MVPLHMSLGNITGSRRRMEAKDGTVTTSLLVKNLLGCSDFWRVFVR